MLCTCLPSVWPLLQLSLSQYTAPVLPLLPPTHPLLLRFSPYSPPHPLLFLPSVMFTPSGSLTCYPTSVSFDTRLPNPLLSRCLFHPFLPLISPPCLLPSALLSFLSLAALSLGPVNRHQESEIPVYVLLYPKMDAFLNQWLWRQEFWLPPGVTWEDMEGTDGVIYPKSRDLLLSVPCALFFTAVRFLFERFVALPLSRHLGIREKYRRQPSANPLLEAFYANEKKQPLEAEVRYLSAQCNMQIRQVESWFRCRRNQDRPSISKKFCEASWRFVFYVISFLTGLVLLNDKPWLWDQREFWTDYPYQPLISSLYWYYIMELGFYSSLLLTISFDVKRKDLKEQIVHHLATIFLIIFSYCANYIRAGSLVMLLHDTADYILELAKMFNYSKWKRVCDVLFIIFAVVFIVTRLVLLPTRVIYSTYYFSMEIFQPFFGYYFFNVLLMVLQILHVFWAYLILRMVYRFTFVGTVENDVRSDIEESEDSGQENFRPPEREKGSNHWRSRNNNCVPHKPAENGASQVINGHSKTS
uniref:Ceramide synthase 4 n=2 Tax=Xenopus tropicalis TaxID=8364 RepID=A0A803J8K2_XENTR